jgi:hypothetical protein
MMSKKAKAKGSVTIPGTKVKLPQWAVYLAGGGVLAALFLMKGQPDEEKLSESSGWLAEEVAQRFAQERDAFAGSVENINRRIDELNKGPEEIITPAEPGGSTRAKKKAPTPSVTPRVWGLPVPINLDDVTLPNEEVVDMARMISKEPGWVAEGQRLAGAAEAYAAGTYGKAPKTEKPITTASSSAVEAGLERLITPESARLTGAAEAYAAGTYGKSPTPKPTIATTTARSSPVAARSERSIRAESARLQAAADKHLKSGYKPKTNKPVTRKSKKSVSTTRRLQAKFDREKRLRTGRVQHVTRRRETLDRKEKEFVPPRWY